MFAAQRALALLECVADAAATTTAITLALALALAAPFAFAFATTAALFAEARFLRRSAIGAAGLLVLEAFGLEKLLLANGEDEVAPAVAALQSLVLRGRWRGVFVNLEAIGCSLLCLFIDVLERGLWDCLCRCLGCCKSR